jgi:hypothetical protein
MGGRTPNQNSKPNARTVEEGERAGDGHVVQRERHRLPVVHRVHRDLLANHLCSI